MTNVLFITYDGLTDPLGQSQIIPYLIGLSAENKIIILSVEKKDRFNSHSNKINKILNNHNIEWRSIKFSQGYGIISKLWDIFNLYLNGINICHSKKVKLIHSRGHPSAQIGNTLKSLFFWRKVKLIFDFRGLWVEERIDKGGWNLNNFSHRIQYKMYKRIERKLIKNSDQIIVLTSKMKDELNTKFNYSLERIHIIPCCVDSNHFTLKDDSLRSRMLSELNIPEDAIVLGYLGSIGSMYRTDKFLRLLEISIMKNINTYGFIITQDVHMARMSLKKFFPKDFFDRVIISSVDRESIPKMLAAIDINIIFLKNSYARIGTCPTKFAESLSCGIPNIINSEIGDMDSQVQSFNAGMVLDNLSDKSLTDCANSLNEVLKLNPKEIREQSLKTFDLSIANSKYRAVYKLLV